VEYIRGLDATVLVISHDRAFLEDVADHMLHLEAGTAVPYTGGYDAFVQQRTLARLAQERAFLQQQRVIAKEEDYIRRNIAGQNSSQAKGRRKRLARVPRLSPPPGEDGTMSLRLEARERGGDQVLVLRDVALRVESRTLIEDFSADDVAVLFFCPMCGWQIDYGIAPAESTELKCPMCAGRFALRLVDGDWTLERVGP
jgi:ATP-binding cassette subfamily F protein 3